MSSYQKPSVQIKEAQKLGFKRDNQLSNDKTNVYTRGTKAVVVHRGTKSYRDALDDVGIFFGRGDDTHSQKNANRVSDRTREKYKGYDIEHTGHSLGGYLAEHSAKGNERVTTVNKHNLGFFTEKKNPNVRNYRNSQDLASVQLSPRKNETIQRKTKRLGILDAHKIDTAGTLFKDRPRNLKRVRITDKGGVLKIGKSVKVTS